MRSISQWLKTNNIHGYSLYLPFLYAPAALMLPSLTKQVNQNLLSWFYYIATWGFAYPTLMISLMLLTAKWIKKGYSEWGLPRIAYGLSTSTIASGAILHFLFPHPAALSYTFWISVVQILLGIAAFIVSFFSSRTAAYLFIPYLVWLFYVWALNSKIWYGAVLGI